MTPHPCADLDFYIEPEWCTAALLALPTFSLIDSVYDPCAGSGNVLKAAVALKFNVTGSDAVDRGRWPVCQFQDVGYRRLQQCFGQVGNHRVAIVSNPPYGGGDTAEEFIRHFVPMRSVEVVAVFVQTRFLHSGKRHALHTRDHRPSIVAHLSDRPSCPPGDALLAGEVEAKGGTQDYTWLIYDKRGWDTNTRTVWLRRPVPKLAKRDEVPV